MKALKYIIWGVLILFTVFYVIPVGLLRVPYFQEKISQKTAEVLHERLGTAVRIERIDFELFNKLILKDLYLEDLSGDTLFQAKRVAVGFEFLPLFHKQLRFNSAQLFTFQLNLSKETDLSPLNLQFVIDAFASKDTTKKDNNIDLQIKNLNLRRGNFSFRVKNAQQTPGQFNAKDIRVRDLSAKMHIRDFTEKQLLATISRLSFAEQSGIRVRRLIFDLAVNSKEASINELQLQLSQTLLSLANIRADYSKLEPGDNLINNSEFNLNIRPSDICLKDISPLVPLFSNYSDKVILEGAFSGTLNNLNVVDLQLSSGNHFSVHADARILNITSPDSIGIIGRIGQSFISAEGIQHLANNFSQEEKQLPDVVSRLGSIRFEGDISGFLYDMKAHGAFSTDIGAIYADVNIGKKPTQFLKGQISSDGLDIRQLTDNADFGNTAFHIDVDARQDQRKKYAGNINALIGETVYKGYKYERLAFAGDFTEKSFRGSLDIDNPEGKVSAEGFVLLQGACSEFNFSASVEDLRLDRLNLIRKYKDASLSFDIDANFTGNSIDNLLGGIRLQDLKFENDHGNYLLDSLVIRASETGAEKLLTIQSNIIKGEIRGLYSFQDLVPSLKKTASRYLPSLHLSNPKALDLAENNFSVNLQVFDTQDISEIFQLPFTLHNTTEIFGEYNNLYDKFRFTLRSPRFYFGKTGFESTTIFLKNPGNSIELDINTKNLQGNNNALALETHFTARNDSVCSVIDWDGMRKKTYRGQFAFNTLFSKASQTAALKADVGIQQSNLIFNDSVWTLHPSHIFWEGDAIKIKRFVADHADQHIRIEGCISQNPTDEIDVDLNKVDLEYIFHTLNIPALQFGGIATGFVKAKDLYNTRELSTSLDVSDFAFNNTLFGDLTLEGNWDDEQQGISMDGIIFKDDSTGVKIDGIIYPVKEELSIVFDAQHANATFLRKYLDKVVQNLSGDLTGKLRLFGDLNNPSVEGDVFARDARFGVEFLNTYYSFTDTVHCTEHEIYIKDVKLLDRNGKAGIVEGSVRHNQFSDFEFDGRLVFNDFLVFDGLKTQNPYLYGTAYASGNARMEGTESLVNINVSLQNNANTKIIMNFMEEDDIEEYDFINFVSPKDKLAKSVDNARTSLEGNKPILLKNDSGTEIKLDLQINANTDATVELIMDPVSGDRISGQGNGNMRVEYGTRTPLRVFGNYAIESGKYNFSFQQVLFRNFEIREGSSISFRGDPYTAELDIDAAYRVTANLGDLDPQLLEQSARNSVPIDCVLKLDGPLDHPLIGFDIELPGSPAELARQVKGYIRTEDEMNRQIVYLLVLSRFYTSPEYTAMSDSRVNNDFTLIAQTLSTQLSNILGSISKTVKVGTRFNQTNIGSETSTEVELLLSSQLLDNRLIINGNFGYIDNPYLTEGGSKGNIPLVGDFDLEYKLNKAGDIRLKGYNHYNYRNYYSLSPEMTQGVGIIFRKDFNSLSDIFGKKLRFFLPLPTDTTDSAGQTNDFIRFKKPE